MQYLIPYCNSRLKIFVPLTVLGFCVLVPVNWTSKTLENAQVTFNEIDKLSISNIGQDTQRYGSLYIMTSLYYDLLHVNKRMVVIVAQWLMYM